MKSIALTPGRSRIPSTVVREPDRDDYDHDHDDRDPDIHVRLPLAGLVAGQTQSSDVVGHVGPRRANLQSRYKDFVIDWAGTAAWSRGARREIGRASCRERV